MLELTTMTAENFEQLDSKIFTVTSTDPEISLELIEVKEMGSGARRGGAFSLLWQGPSEPTLEQATYQLSQNEIGRHEIFLVPVAEKEAGIQYEAVFT